MRLKVSNALRLCQPYEATPAAGGKDSWPRPIAMRARGRAAVIGELAAAVLARAKGCVDEALHRLEHLLELLCFAALLSYAALPVTQLSASAQAELLHLRLGGLPTHDCARAWRVRRLTCFHPCPHLLCARLLCFPVREHSAGEKRGVPELRVDLVKPASTCIHLEHDAVDELLGPLGVLPVLVDEILRVDSILVEFPQRCLARALRCRLLCGIRRAFAWWRRRGRGELGHRLNFEVAVDVVRRHFLVLLAGPAEATLVSRHRYAWHHRGHSA
mmetsp:Transcript_45783/g.103149  ORF Transcript_45783/g.103149 Transcript_45783/m.103149 type:complete len:273 (+) Transcript_45783:308-1126(+)